MNTANDKAVARTAAANDEEPPLGAMTTERKAPPEPEAKAERIGENAGFEATVRTSLTMSHDALLDITKQTMERIRTQAQRQSDDIRTKAAAGAIPPERMDRLLAAVEAKKEKLLEQYRADLRIVVRHLKIQVNDTIDKLASGPR